MTLQSSKTGSDMSVVIIWLQDEFIYSFSGDVSPKGL